MCVHFTGEETKLREEKRVARGHRAGRWLPGTGPLLYVAVDPETSINL